MSSEAPIKSISPWWVSKNVLDLGLITYSTYSMVRSPILDPFWKIPREVGQGMVILGAIIFFWHYFLLKRGTENLAEPITLVKSGGLFSWIRHPMYLGDLTWMTGCMLIVLDGIAMGMWLGALLSIIMQSFREDLQLEQIFGEEFSQWKSQTKRLVPGIF